MYSEVEVRPEPAEIVVNYAYGDHTVSSLSYAEGLDHMRDHLGAASYSSCQYVVDGMPLPWILLDNSNLYCLGACPEGPSGSYSMFPERILPYKDEECSLHVHNLVASSRRIASWCHGSLSSIDNADLKPFAFWGPEAARNKMCEYACHALSCPDLENYPYLGSWTTYAGPVRNWGDASRLVPVYGSGTTSHLVAPIPSGIAASFFTATHQSRDICENLGLWEACGSLSTSYDY